VVEVTEADALGSVDDWFTALDQPSIDGLNTFLVAKAVRAAGVTVALSGLGGDELFGGYAHLRRADRRPLPSFASAALERLLRPESAVWRLLAGRGGRIDKALAMLAARDAAATYSANRALFVLPAVRDLVAPSYRAQWCSGGNRSLLTSTSTRGEGVRAQILLELQNYLPNVLLRDSDVMAMWHGLEVRVPFLDKDLVDYVVDVGPGDLSGQSGLKPLLAAAMGHSARPQPRKLGFSLPMARWLRGPLRADVERRLGRLEWAGEFLTTEGALSRWRRLQGGEDRAWTRVWAIYVLDRWLEREHTRRGKAPPASG
jgi:asparagine synthase (glutamine-hydrolysing)